MSDRPITRSEIRQILVVIFISMVLVGGLVLASSYFLSKSMANDLRDGQRTLCLHSNINIADTNVSRLYIQRVADGTLRIVELVKPKITDGDLANSIDQLAVISRSVDPVEYLDCDTLIR